VSKVKSLMSIGAAAIAVASAVDAQAAISLTGPAYTNDFSTLPTVADGFSVNGAIVGVDAAQVSDVTTMDALIQTTSAATYGAVLTDTSTLPPSTNMAFRYRANEDVLQSRATGGAVTTLLVQGTQNTGGPSAITLAYDQTLPAVVGTETPGEQVPGHYVYFSPTGAAGSWVNLGTDLGTAGAKSFASPAVANGNPFYFLFVDDNALSPAAPAPATVDQGYWIDNLSLTTIPEPGSIGVLAVGALGLLARRRRQA